MEKARVGAVLTYRVKEAQKQKTADNRCNTQKTADNGQQTSGKRGREEKVGWGEGARKEGGGWGDLKSCSIEAHMPIAYEGAPLMALVFYYPYPWPRPQEHPEGSNCVYERWGPGRGASE
jgi:hypothetical protein